MGSVALYLWNTWANLSQARSKCLALSPNKESYGVVDVLKPVITAIICLYSFWMLWLDPIQLCRLKKYLKYNTTIVLFRDPVSAFPLEEAYDVLNRLKFSESTIRCFLEADIFKSSSLSPAFVTTVVLSLNFFC